MRKLLLVATLLVVVLSGCQLDIQGPSMTAKVLRKGENNNQEYLSRGSGMTGGNSYAAGGGSSLQSTGKGGGVMSWGDNK
jgi:hypothetical protein